MPEPMHILNESHILLFLLQVFLLLSCARGLGLLFQRWGQPSITAEILVGLFFGPTVLGRLWPSLQQQIFPSDPVQQGMLEAVAWLGILFFLLDTGLKTDFATAWRQRHSALIISLSDLILPMLLAFVPCLLLPNHFLAPGSSRLLFALFVATIMTISALPVTARVLQDLNLYRTDMGLLIMCALTINDVAGWLVFAVILGLAGEAISSLAEIPLIIGATIAFALAALTAGRRATEFALDQFHRWQLPEPGVSLTFVALLGLLGGALTTWIGVHALFGFFIVGIMAGEARALSENTRHVMSQMVHAILVPIFFATIGLKLDFADRFHAGLAMLLLALGIGGRFLGAWVGSALSRQPRRHWPLISAAHTPGGEMQIVIGLLAVEYGVITDTVFVAIIFGAVVSSVILGPWMRIALRGIGYPPLVDCFAADAVYLDLPLRDRDSALRELTALAARRLGAPPAEVLYAAVAAREADMGTALGNGVAVPHARLSGLKHPILIITRAQDEIDWNAPDGMPVRLIFLLLTPREDASLQIRILGAIARAVKDETSRNILLTAPTPEAFQEILCRRILGGNTSAAQSPA